MWAERNISDHGCSLIKIDKSEIVRFAQNDKLPFAKECLLLVTSEEAY